MIKHHGQELHKKKKRNSQKFGLTWFSMEQPNPWRWWCRWYDADDVERTLELQGTDPLSEKSWKIFPIFRNFRNFQILWRTHDEAMDVIGLNYHARWSSLRLDTNSLPSLTILVIRENSVRFPSQRRWRSRLSACCEITNLKTCVDITWRFYNLKLLKGWRIVIEGVLRVVLQVI